MPRIEIPLAGSSKQHRSSIVAAQVSKNWFVEIVRDDQGKEVFRVLIGAPGKTLLSTVSAQPLRALHMSSTKYAKYWGVFGNKLFEFLNNNNAVFIGTLRTSNGKCKIADNGTHLLIVDGSTTGYVYEIASGGPAGFTEDLALANANFVGGDDVTFTGGWFFVIQPGSNIIQACAAPYGTAPIAPWDATSLHSTALTEAGPLLALGVANTLLWAIGDYSSAVFQNTANPVGFPYSRITGTSIDIGIEAAQSLKELNGTLLWLGKTKKGGGFIVQTSGLTPTRVSDHDLENTIGAFTTRADAYADVYIDEGHSFYQLTFPTGNQTRVYDQATKEWHERSSSGLGRDRAKGHIFFLNRHIVGDSTTGKLYTLSLDVYDEAGQPLIAIRRSQHLKSRRDPIEIPQLLIETDVGVGLSGDAQGSNPVMALRYSIDSGKTWSEEMYSELGKIGEYSAIARFPRLGTAEDWIFEISISDPVSRNILSAYIEV